MRAFKNLAMVNLEQKLTENGSPGLLTLGFSVNLVKNGKCFQLTVIPLFCPTNGKDQNSKLLDESSAKYSSLAVGPVPETFVSPY